MTVWIPVAFPDLLEIIADLSLLINCDPEK
jgi:hypothetical protein